MAPSLKPFLDARPPRWDSTLLPTLTMQHFSWETVATCLAAGVLLTVRSRVGPSTVYASPALGQPPGSSGRRLRGQGLLMQGGSKRSQPASVRLVGKQAGVIPGVGAPVRALRGALPASLGPSSRCVWHR